MKNWKKWAFACNALLLIMLLAWTIRFMQVGGMRVKTITASVYTALGLINLTLTMFIHRRALRFALPMTLGLVACLLGDVLLNGSFILGAGFFALGHVLYTAAFCLLQPIKRRDLVLSGALGLISTAIVLFWPSLDIPEAFIRIGCVVYGLVISCMVGKAVGTVLSLRSAVTWATAAGAVLFYFSDLMLVMYYFGDASRLADRLCLITYFPAQGLMALSILLNALKEKDSKRPYSA